MKVLLLIALVGTIALAAACGMPQTVIARGELIAVERDEVYDPICGFLSRRITGCESAPLTYAAIVVADTQWPKFNPKKPKQYFMFFAPPGNAIPMVGWMATWILHRRELVRLSTCTLFGYQSDVGHALDSDDDVRSYHDFGAIVDSLSRKP